MLVIRMQRTGRKGHAQFRIVVQDSRRTPTSGKIVAQVGTYDPHSKAINLDKDRAQHYLEHGAQPSPRVVMVLKAEGVVVPDWVKQAAPKTSAIRNTEKLRRNQPAAEVEEAAPEPVAEATEPAAEEPTEAVAASTEEAPEKEKA